MVKSRNDPVSLEFLMQEPVTVEELASIGIESQEADNSAVTTEEKASRIEKVKKILLSKAEMLDDYFGMKIDRNGKLRTIPLLLGKFDSIYIT